MRKFKIKNRQKRKYVRKTVTSTHAPLLRSRYMGIWPLLFLAAALFTTMLIGLNAQNHIVAPQITFKMPEFSLSVLLDPRPAGIFIVHWLTSFEELVVWTISGMWLAFIQGVLHIAATLITLGLMTNHALVLVYATTVTILTVINETLLSIGITIVTATTHVLGGITAAINRWIDALLNILGTPFRVLGAFWMQIKPYIAILGLHMQFSINDLTTGFADLGNVVSLLKK